jgi:hypothetical protein
MGLDVNGTQFVLYTKTLGVDFTRMAMIGRQGLHLSPDDLKRNLAKFGFSFDETMIDRIFSADNGYAEEYFRTFGAKEIHSFDNSDYEGATHVHNLNQEIPEQYKKQYNVVFDGGSLEHVFNFPTAIKNCMEMVQVGGYYLAITPANNLMGHGFYQFSPELFYSIFNAGNGYELVSLIAFENKLNSEWYSVTSPESVKGRVTLTNSRSIYLFVIAKRTEDIVPFQSTPQQSDYVTAWNSKEDFSASLRTWDKTTELKNLLRAAAMQYTPQSIKILVKLMLWNTELNPKFFQPIRRTDGVKSLKTKKNLF